MLQASLSGAAPPDIATTGFISRDFGRHQALGFVRDKGHLRREQTSCLKGQRVEFFRSRQPPINTHGRRRLGATRLTT